MRFTQLLLTVLLVFAGCKGSSGLGPKVDNPVVGPPPPRRTGASNADQSEQFAKSDRDGAKGPLKTGVELMSRSDSDRDSPRELDGSRVVATVNGAPILEAEILERYAEQLAQMKEKAPPEIYRKQTEQIIERDLRVHVERKLLSEATRKALKKDQQKQLDGFVKKQLQEQLEEMKRGLGVTSTAELDRELQKRGTSLAMIEYQFRNKTLAQQYIAGKVKNNKKLSRQDLIAYYHKHLKDYEIKRRVKWQQILISRANEEQARAKLRILSDGLTQKPPRDFGELAAELSDGPTAENKGIYDWTNAGSLADEQIEKLLFELPIGHPSDLIESPRSYQFVRVLARQEAGHTPFDEVQDAIRTKLQEEGQQVEIDEVLKEPWDTATIESEYNIQGYESPGS